MPLAMPILPIPEWTCLGAILAVFVTLQRPGQCDCRYGSASEQPAERGRALHCQARQARGWVWRARGWLACHPANGQCLSSLAPGGRTRPDTIACGPNLQDAAFMNAVGGRHLLRPVADHCLYFG